MITALCMGMLSLAFANSTLLQAMRVETTFGERPTPMEIEDVDRSVVYVLGANIPGTQFPVKLNDYLDLRMASSREFISPSLNGCQLTDFFFDTLGPGNQILQFGARESAGNTACRDFFRGISTSGLTMKFTNVPLLNNRSRVFKEVEVRIKIPRQSS